MSYSYPLSHYCLYYFPSSEGLNGRGLQAWVVFANGVLDSAFENISTNWPLARTKGVTKVSFATFLERNDNRFRYVSFDMKHGVCSKGKGIKLSKYIMGGVLRNMPMSWRREVIRVIFDAATGMQRYSALALERATESYFLALHKTQFELMNM